MNPYWWGKFMTAVAKTLAGDKVTLFKYPWELMSKHVRGVNDDSYVAFNPRTKEWGYVSNKGWCHYVWYPESARSMDEQQKGETFPIDFETVNRLNNHPLRVIKVVATQYQS